MWKLHDVVFDFNGAMLAVSLAVGGLGFLTWLIFVITVSIGMIRART